MFRLLKFIKFEFVSVYEDLRDELTTEEKADILLISAGIVLLLIILDYIA